MIPAGANLRGDRAQDARRGRRADRLPGPDSARARHARRVAVDRSARRRVLLPRDYIEWSRDLTRPADPDDPFVSPLRAADHSGLPPALVVTGELDPFRDEGAAYAAKLGAEHVRYPGLIHHAVLVPRQISLGERVIRETARRIGAALEETA